MAGTEKIIASAQIAKKLSDAIVGFSESGVGVDHDSVLKALLDSTDPAYGEAALALANVLRSFAKAHGRTF